MCGKSRIGNTSAVCFLLAGRRAVERVHLLRCECPSAHSTGLLEGGFPLFSPVRFLPCLIGFYRATGSDKGVRTVNLAIVASVESIAAVGTHPFQDAGECTLSDRFLIIHTKPFLLSLDFFRLCHRHSPCVDKLDNSYRCCVFVLQNRSNVPFSSHLSGYRLHYYTILSSCSQASSLSSPACLGS